MLNSIILNNEILFKNKYFFILCLYLKNKVKNSNYINEFIFQGYKYNYLILNINILLKNLKNLLNIIKNIMSKNGNILILHTNNHLLNILLQINCNKYNLNFLLPDEDNCQINIFKKLNKFPDLVLSLDYKYNYHFLTKLTNINVPIICITDFLSRNVVNNMYYYLIINNNSFYINILLIFLIFNNIDISRKKFLK